MFLEQKSIQRDNETQTDTNVHTCVISTVFLAKVLSHPLMPSVSFSTLEFATALSSSVTFGLATMASCSILSLARVGRVTSMMSNMVFHTRMSVVCGAHVVISTPTAVHDATS